MELDVLTMPRNEARQAFLAYREEVRRPRDEASRKQDEAMMRAYRAAAKGTPLIRLSDAIARGGATTFQEPVYTGFGSNRKIKEHRAVALPRLAIVNADATRCWTHGIRLDGSLRLLDKRNPGPTNKRNIFNFAKGTFPEQETQGDLWGEPRLRAIVPTIPPSLRPDHALRNYHILFEAEWGIDPQPPVDPALLKHVGGDLYAVLAAWDLTPIERAVLAGEDLRGEQ